MFRGFLGRRPHRGALAIFTWHHYGAGPDVDAAPV
jgi:DNA-3-methyladenine glycosylase II